MPTSSVQLIKNFISYTLFMLHMIYIWYGHITWTNLYQGDWSYDIRDWPYDTVHIIILAIWYGPYHNIVFLWHFDNEHDMCFKTRILYLRNSVNMSKLTLIVFKPFKTHAICSHDLNRNINFTNHVSHFGSLFLSSGSQRDLTLSHRIAVRDADMDIQ